MKGKKNLLEQLKALPYFNKDTLYQLGEQLKLESSTIDTYISRFLKYKDILRLKNGLYVTTDFFEKNKSDISYSFYLANIIRTPSYVSSWAALQYYNLTTEAIHSITSITPKVTRKYQTKAGNFVYQSIKKDIFSDFSLVEGKFNFYIASPAKALFDLLYFRTRQLKGIKLEDIEKIVEDLRVDFDEMDKKEQKKFYSLINKNI
jgi:predicted transcriptional regulator of viral defense system